MRIMKFGGLFFAIVFICKLTLAADYNIERQADGPFSFTISGVEINEGSSMTRESILFNDPKCPFNFCRTQPKSSIGIEVLDFRQRQR